jgi:hypothetical protein
MVYLNPMQGPQSASQATRYSNTICHFINSLVLVPHARCCEIYGILLSDQLWVSKLGS